VIDFGSMDESAERKPTPVERGIYTSAFLCAQTIQDKKDDVLTAIRLVDNFTVTLPSGPAPLTFNPPVQTKLVIIFKTEKFERFKATIALRKPNGESQPTSFDTTSEPGIAGRVLLIDVILNSNEPGDYWFDILVDDAVATRVPLNITRRLDDAPQPLLGEPPKPADLS
jgi:hypothetical protein